MTHRRTLAAAALLLSSLAFACGGSTDASTSPPADDGAAEEDLTKTLSKPLVCAAAAAADESNLGSDLTSIPQSKLKGDALRDFKAWQKGMVDDYPSQAFELPVKFKGRTYTFWLVVEMNDGGGSQGIYKTTDGSTVTSESGGESASVEWSAPANNCD
ncbi:MAG: hypothetical protein JWP87_652 [Labilithrix sp.]|nr:hypothetical protein [Labilithrix sp.]